MAANKRKILGNAQKYLQKGQLDKALKEFRTLVELDPRDSNSRLKLGDVYLRQGNRDAAIEAYKQVAVQFMKDGFDAKAVALYKQIAKIDEKRWEIYEPLAELYERLGLTAEALAALQTAADAYRREGRRREALELLRRMARLDPTNTTSRLKIADLLAQADMRDDALAEYDAVVEELERQGAQEQLAGVYERVLELDPERTGALAALARVLLAQGQGERAEPFARRLVEQDAESVEGHELLGEILRSQGREDAAEASYRRLAELYRIRGDEEKAREVAQRFLGAEDFSAAQAELGVDPEDSLIGSLGGPGEPILAADRTPPSGAAGTGPSAGDPSEPGPADAGRAEAPADPEQALAEARVYLRYRKLERAMATLEALLTGAPEHVGALECLGEARVEAGDRAGAVEAWRRGAEAARARGDAASARALGERIAALDPAAAEALAGNGDELPVERTASPAPEPATLEDVDLEIEIGDEGEGLEDSLLEARDGGEAEGDRAGEPSLEDPGPSSPAGTSGEDGDDLDAGGDELELDVDLSLSGFDEPLGEGEPPGEGAGGSSTTPQQIAEDLEEADFYFQQGMLEEAERVYRRVLDAAPSHPQAQLRLGEILERRGEDPGSSGAPSAPALEREPELGRAGASDTGTAGDLAETGDAGDAGDAGDDLGADLVDWESGELTDPPAEEPSPRPEATAPEPEIDVDLDFELDEPEPAERETDPGDSRQAPDLAFESGEDQTSVELSASPAAEELQRWELSETQPEFPEEETGEHDEPGAPDGAAIPPGSAPQRPPAQMPEAAPTPETAPTPAGPDEAGFDLAAELSDVLEGDEDPGDTLSGVSDQGFEAVFREFKKGVREQLSESDYEAHYDLGIAYREMGLLEDAVGEFRTALASPERKLSCLHMLGLCALDLGRPGDAVSHLEQALALPEVPEREQAVLRFDLGRGFEAAGDGERARAAYEAVAAVDPDYQDVRARLDALAAGGPALGEPRAGSAAGEETVETFESFDDLIAEAEAIMGEEEDEEEAEEVAPAPEARDDSPSDPAPPPRKKRKISFL